MKKNSLTVVAVSICAGWGAVVWLGSSYITGRREPWDARSLIYPLSLFIAGFIGAALIPRRFWIAPLAVWAGQTIGLLWRVFTFPDSGGLWPLGLVIALPVYSLLSLFGACLGGLQACWFTDFFVEEAENKRPFAMVVATLRQQDFSKTPNFASAPTVCSIGRPTTFV